MPLRIPGSRERSPVDGRVGEGRAPDWGGCSYDGEEKEERTVIERYKGGGGGDRSVTATCYGLLAAEGCAYAVDVRGRGTDGRDVTEG